MSPEKAKHSTKKVLKMRKDKKNMVAYFLAYKKMIREGWGTDLGALGKG